MSEHVRNYKIFVGKYTFVVFEEFCVTFKHPLSICEQMI